MWVYCWRQKPGAINGKKERDTRDKKKREEERPGAFEAKKEREKERERERET